MKIKRAFALTWGYGNPHNAEDSQLMQRVATKIVSAGRCQITYSVVEELVSGHWRFKSITISVKQFLGNAPAAPAPPEGPGDRRHGCAPSQAKFHPHLCLSVEPESKQTQCIGDAANMAPCPGAQIVGRPEQGEPGHEFANGSDPLVQQWIEQERRKAENERRHDAQCAANPSEPCAPYPYEQWSRQG